MYDAGYFFVPNPINRYTVSSRNKFVTNADGSVDLYLQADSPGKAKEANAKFIPMLRLYWPKQNPPSIIDGTWKPPAATRSYRQEYKISRPHRNGCDAVDPNQAA
jgi:hypothetical protein